MKRGWKIAIAIFAGFFVLVGIITAIGGESTVGEPAKTDTQRHKEARDSILPEEEAEEIEDYTVEPREADKTVTEVYDEVQLGMTEEQVWEIAGKPDITSQADIEGMGSAMNMIYSDDHSLDNVTVSIQNGTVKLIVIGEFDADGAINARSKM